MAADAKKKQIQTAEEKKPSGQRKGHSRQQRRNRENEKIQRKKRLLQNQLLAEPMQRSGQLPNGHLTNR